MRLLTTGKTHYTTMPLENLPYRLVKFSQTESRLLINRSVRRLLINRSSTQHSPQRPLLRTPSNASWGLMAGVLLLE